MNPQEDLLASLEARLGHSFAQRTLLEEALTHPSFLVQYKDAGLRHNQRLEFLGDAVLGLVLAEQLHQHFPEAREGFLTQARAALVQGSSLSTLGRALELERHLRMGDAELRDSQQYADSTLEDAYEALIGALYLDGGLEIARTFINACYGDLQARLRHLLSQHNPKGRLQEQAHQKELNPPDYRITGIEGPEHRRRFQAEVWIGQDCLGKGEGSSKKEAEEAAAEEALQALAIK